MGSEMCIRDSYWTSPGTVATVVQMAKGLVSDGRPDLGDTGTVSL